MLKVYVFSRGEYISLSEDFLIDKANIRIHNVRDKDWYDSEVKNGIVMFFNDLRIQDLSFLDRVKAQYLKGDYKYFTKKNCLEILNFIKSNKNKDIAVHCEYGKSRSVAIALYLKKKFNYEVMNKTEKELEKANDWMLRLMEKYD